MEDWELDSIADEIDRAFRSKTTIRLSHWQKGRIKHDYSVPIEINLKNKSIVIDDSFGTREYLFDKIVAATLID